MCRRESPASAEEEEMTTSSSRTTEVTSRQCESRMDGDVDATNQRRDEGNEALMFIHLLLVREYLV